MMTTSTAAFGQQERMRATMMPAVLDPTLLQDLAEGLEFLNRQLDDSEADLERSREQSLAFEQDARRWEKEAERLRDEAGQTRQALEQLREELAAGREVARQQQEQMDKVAAELSELLAARSDLEQLAAEQQRALVLSLELLKRMNAEAPVVEAPAAPAAASVVDDRELAEARAALAQLGALHAELDAARSEAAAARAELDLARAKADRLGAEREAPPAVEDSQKLRDAETEIALQTAEVESRGAIIAALENALEEQNRSLRSLEERFLAYAERVQQLQLERLEDVPTEDGEDEARGGFVAKFAAIFSPSRKRS